MNGSHHSARMPALLLVLVVAGGFLYFYFRTDVPGQELPQVAVTDSTPSSMLIPDSGSMVNDLEPSHVSAAMGSGTASSSSKSTLTTIQASAQTKSYAYLFQASRDPKTSNIVGDFGSGAFAWYVPDWLVANWRFTSDKSSPDMVFAPIRRDNADDFTNISFIVKPSTEQYNANSLYQTRLDTAHAGTIVLREVVLNQHEGDAISIQMETETRIYHIVSRDDGGLQTRDTYYMDGNGKTLVVSFGARTDIFTQFSDHIRSLVEGIGELKAPQG